MAARCEPVLGDAIGRVGAVRTLVGLAGERGGDDFFAVAQQTLQALVAERGVLGALPPADGERFSRRLLYTDPLQRFGIWALGWPPGCRTPIHNHHCACAFAVCDGTIEEVLYAAGARDAVVETGRALRPAGYVGGAPVESGIVHGMGNRSDGMALSIHLYAYRPDRHEDSIDRRFDVRSDRQDPR